MRKYILLIGILISLATYSQPDPEVLIREVAEEMRLVDNYRADVLIKIDIDFINIKERKAVVYFEKPDKFDIKVKGLVLMPKKGAQMEYFNLIKQKHTAIYTGEDTLKEQGAHTIKIIPISDSSEIVLGKLWIGKKDHLIHRMQSYTKTSGTYTLDIYYAGHPLNLPDKIKISFEMEGNRIPASMTGDMTELIERVEQEENTQGIVWLMYSNYVVNYLK